MILLSSLLLSGRNGSYSIISEEDVERPRVNGIHDGDDDDNACALLPRGSQDTLLTNGYVHPVNGALKPQDSVSFAEHRPHVVDTGSHQSHLPQAGCRDREEPSCSSTGSKANSHQSSLISTASPAKKPDPHNMQKDLHQDPTSNPGTSAATQKSNLQDQTRVRLNGSYHMTPNSSILANSSNQPGRSTAQEAEAGIISEFFSHSRLHHISTWRNEFSEYVNALQSRRRAAGGAVFSGKEKLKKIKANCSSGSLSFVVCVCVFFMLLCMCLCNADFFCKEKCFCISLWPRYLNGCSSGASVLYSSCGYGLLFCIRWDQTPTRSHRYVSVS